MSQTATSATSATDKFTAAMAACPLVAILRGLQPDEAVEVGLALVENGFHIIEVPLNSPQPFVSIARLVDALPDHILLGAGTVLNTGDVEQLADAGGQLMVSPNTVPAVIAAAAAKGMVTLPGFATPTEGFAALDAGATGLKLFPTDGYPPSYIKAVRAVLPAGLPILAVGGVNTENMQPWVDMGASGFGLGSSLYQAGRSAEETGIRAKAHVDAVRATGLCR